MKLVNKIKIPLIPVLTHLTNNIIVTTKYPTAFKKTKIIPLLKKDKDETSPESYRGINLIPALAKITDKVIYNQLLRHLESNDLIPQHHHGGFQGKSTSTALTTLIDYMGKQLRERDWTL